MKEFKDQTSGSAYLVNSSRLSDERFVDWETSIKKGNKYFDSNNLDQAKKSYVVAKELALALFENGINPERAIPALIISCHNLADLYQKREQLKLAYQELDEVDSFLVNYLDTAKKNFKKINAIRRGIDKTRAELLSFIQKNKIELAYVNVVSTSKH